MKKTILMAFLLAWALLSTVYGFIQKTAAEKNYALAEAHRMRAEANLKEAEMARKEAEQQRMIAEKTVAWALTNEKQLHEALQHLEAAKKKKP
jgi:hypothetical protein